MKRLKLTLSGFLLSVASFGQVKVLSLGEKVVSLSSYVTSGHIAVFIFSTYGCAPCEKLKKEIVEKYGNKKHIDIFYCLIGEKDDYYNWKTFQKKPVPQYWANIERISEFPILFIYSPAGNLLDKYTAIDENAVLDIERTLNYLLSNLSYFTDIGVRQPGEKYKNMDKSEGNPENSKKKVTSESADSINFAQKFAYIRALDKDIQNDSISTEQRQKMLKELCNEYSIIVNSLTDCANAKKMYDFTVNVLQRHYSANSTVIANMELLKEKCSFDNKE